MLIFEHDLFRKTGTHFSGSCFKPTPGRSRSIAGRRPILKSKQAGAKGRAGGLF
jgi:hypothetical protein